MRMRHPLLLVLPATLLGLGLPVLPVLACPPEPEAQALPGDPLAADLEAPPEEARETLTAPPEIAPPEAGPAPAAEPETAAPLSALLALASVAPDELDDLRGGFEAPGGLQMSFGIERVVLINGVIQSTTQVHLDDLGHVLSGTALPADLLQGTTLAIVQNGLNNSVSAGLSPTSLATVVQNSLDNQIVQTLTTINVAVNSAEMLRGLRMEQSLQDALNRASLTR
jgi:hypothetical protein